MIRTQAHPLCQQGKSRTDELVIPVTRRDGALWLKRRVGYPQPLHRNFAFCALIRLENHRQTCNVNSMAVVEAFTLILTKGVHLISHEAADAIRSAVERDDLTVEVELDPLGNAAKHRLTLIAVRHVVAITRNESVDAQALPTNVALLRRQTSRLAGTVGFHPERLQDLHQPLE